MIPYLVVAVVVDFVVVGFVAFVPFVIVVVAVVVGDLKVCWLLWYLWKYFECVYWHYCYSTMSDLVNRKLVIVLNQMMVMIVMCYVGVRNWMCVEVMVEEFVVEIDWNVGDGGYGFVVELVAVVVVDGVVAVDVGDDVVSVDDVAVVDGDVVAVVVVADDDVVIVFGDADVVDVVDALL